MSEPIKTKIPAEFESAVKGGYVTETGQIIDRGKNKPQNEINQETDNQISGIKGGSTKSIANLDSEINGNGGINGCLEKGAPDYGPYLGDGLHPNVIGCKIMGNYVSKILKAFYFEQL